MSVETVLPFAFPYGLGGPKSKRQTAISLKSCIQRYLRLAMPQFMTPDVSLVLHQMFPQQISNKNGVMTCRNQYNGHDVRKILSKLTVQDFQDAAQNPNSTTNNNVQYIAKSVMTKCKRLVILLRLLEMHGSVNLQ